MYDINLLFTENRLALMGYVRTRMREMGMSGEEIAEYQNKANALRYPELVRYSVEVLR